MHWIAQRIFGGNYPVWFIVAAFVMFGQNVAANAQIGPSQTATTTRRQKAIRQTTPATCGPAALATLFTLYFNDPTSESEMARLAGLGAKPMSNLRELRDASRAKGYAAYGFDKWSLLQLLQEVESSDTPILAHFKKPTEHFVLVLGRVEGLIVLYDPAKGDVTISEDDFLRRWDNFVLVVRGPAGSLDRALRQRRTRSVSTRIETLRYTSSLMGRTRF